MTTSKIEFPARRRSVSRPRRTAEEAHRRILDATERRLIDGGPEAVRLQDIAADVGISHPGILHHFGSRERLLAALAKRAIGNLERELLAILATRREGDPRRFRRWMADRFEEAGPIRAPHVAGQNLLGTIARACMKSCAGIC